jgi:hypothetical protein
MLLNIARWDRLLIALGFFVFVVVLPSRADAYAWMIKHDYAGCNQCHADPSGGGLLTLYGRAQGEILLRTRYRAKPDEEAGNAAWFLFGAVPLPEDVLLGGDIRYFYFDTRPVGGKSTAQNFFMQADLEGEVTESRLHVNGSIGYAEKGDLLASITSSPQHNIISRVHWVGLDIGKDNEFMLRAGRMNLPFGIRSVEHTQWVRTATRTDIEIGQQHGISLAYNSDIVRGEAMFIAGNFQLSPAAYRDRGFCGYLEVIPAPRLALGVSTLVVHADLDFQLQVANWRQAHGAFLRWAPIEPVVILAESDLLVHSEQPRLISWGHADLVQLDLEPIHGFHLMATGEVQDVPPTTKPESLRAWGSFDWFFAPHADIRADVIYQSTPAGATRAKVVYLLAQLHLFL